MNEEVNVQETVEPVIKKKLELDIDVTPHNQGENPFLKWIHLARTVDAWRIFPRAFLTVYIILFFVALVAGMGAIILTLVNLLAT